MSASHHYWVLPDDDATIGAAMRAAGPGIVPGGLATGQGAAGNLALVKVRADAAGTAPAGIAEMDLPAWLAYSASAPRAPFTPGTEWTLAERGVLVAEATAGTYPSGCAGGWESAERVDVAGVPHRLCRYTGTKPAGLVGTVLYPADIAALLGGK